MIAVARDDFMSFARTPRKTSAIARAGRRPKQAAYNGVR
jgi:hypothetical protein